MVKRLLCALVACVFISVSAHAQDSAELSGFVSDPQKAMVPGATVAVTMASTGAVRSTVTDGTGHYVFAALQPGTYAVQVTMDGFQTTEAQDVVLHVTDRVALNFELQLGAVSQRVEITGSAGQLMTRSGTVSTVIDRQFVENMPMNGRSFQSLITLTPGVVQTPATGANAGQFVVNGMRSDDNYFTVDGVSTNLGTVAGPALYQGAGGQLPALSAIGGTNSLVSMDAMEEFRIQTSSFAPEFGRLPGGQINIATRSGTNQFHGTGFEYFRHDALNANEWFANRAGLPKAKERSNDFGGVLGGPIVRNRMFFFGSYEGQRIRQPITINTIVPSAAIRAAAPASQQVFLAAFPQATGPAFADGSAPFVATTTNPASVDATSAKLDQRGSKFVLFGRYNYSPSSSSNRGALPGTESQGRTTVKTATAGVTYTFSSRALNDLRVNYSANVVNSVVNSISLGGSVPLTDAVLPPGTNAKTGYVGYVLVSGASATGAYYGGFSEAITTQYSVTDTFSLNLSRHQVKLGFDIRHLTPSSKNVDVTELAVFTGMTGPGGLSTGIPLQSSVNKWPSFPVTLLTRNYSLFAQDTWSVSPRLTLTYGLRWDMNPPLEGANAESALVPLTNASSPATIGVGTRGAPLYEMSWKNVAPRVGVSYQARQNAGGETVISGGFGIFYSATLGTLGSVNAGYPFGSSATYVLTPFPLTAAQIAATPPMGQLPANQIYGADPNLVTPNMRQWNVSVDQALGKAQSLTVSYIGSAGRDLYRKNRYSAPNATFTSSIYLTGNSGVSDYKSLQVKFNRRLSSSLRAMVNYTWSHSQDNASDDQSYIAVAPTVTFNPNVDYGDSDNDVRHIVAGAVTYQIPSPIESGVGRALLGGWSVDSLFNARSSTPLFVLGGSVSSGGVVWSPRPNVVPGVPVYLYGSQYPGGMRLNPAAFSNPGPTQGNLERNSLRGFGAWQVDFAVHRQFQLTSAVGLQLRAEVFNILNHTNFGPPASPGAANNNITSATFGIATQTLASSLGGINPIFQFGGPRSGQLAVRLQF